LTIATQDLRPAEPVPAPRLPGEEERLRVLHDYSLDSLEDDPELAAIAGFAS
jgi:hypothetical protein